MPVPPDSLSPTSEGLMLGIASAAWDDTQFVGGNDDKQTKA